MTFSPKGGTESAVLEGCDGKVSTRECCARAHCLLWYKDRILLENARDCKPHEICNKMGGYSGSLAERNSSNSRVNVITAASPLKARAATPNLSFPSNRHPEKAESVRGS